MMSIPRGGDADRVQAVRRRGSKAGSGRPVRALVLLAALAAGSSARGAEPWQKFVDGLRDRGYYNTALEYLDQAEQGTSTPAEFREKIAYERAQVLLASASALVSLDERRAQLDRAEQELTRFVTASPQHPLAARAKSDRAGILIGRAQVDLWQAADAADEQKKNELRTRGRDLLGQARGILTQAIEQHRADWRTYPTSIPESDVARRRARDAALDRLMQSQLAAAEVQYWEARSYAEGSPQRTAALEKAVEAFEDVAQQYSQSLAGMYAKVWQGKCYEELGDVRRALGVFDLILAYDDQQPAVLALKDVTQRFRLICLNHEQRKDYAVVIEEAEGWLRQNRDRALTAAGLGIQWELCRALELQVADRNRSDAQRRGDLTAALERARTVSRFGGEHKAAAARMAQRLVLALDRKGTDVRDFASAYAAATSLMETAQTDSEAYRAAVAEGDDQRAAELQRTIRATGDEMARLLTLAIRLRGSSTEADKAAMARLQLAYAYFLQGRYLDCAVLAEHQLKADATEFPDLARSAGALAISALEAAGGAASEASGNLEREWQARIAEDVVRRWPDAEQSQAARMAVARSHWVRDEPLKAADWWSQIPASSAQYPAAQISAGQAYWSQYVQASRLPDSERPDAVQLRNWKQAAIERLANGIEKRQQGLAENAPTPDDLVIGKATLAQIRNSDGVFQADGGTPGAVELLTQGPHSVVEAVRAPLNGERPKDPRKAQSEHLAGFAWQQLLRSYIGLKDLDAARKAREELEAVAGASNPAALTAIYVEFGRELQRELDQLAASGEAARAASTRRGFEEFLSDLSGRVDGQTFSSLLWVAETFAGLAEGADDPADAERGFAKSAGIYQQMLARVDEAGFLPAPEYRDVLKLQLAGNLRRQGEFSEAETMLLGILESNPSAPDAQFEAARLYQEWGASKTSGNEDRLRTAIVGRPAPVEIWGWTSTIQRLQKQAAGASDERLLGLLTDARYQLARTELALSRVVSDDRERDKHLALARHAIFTFVRSRPEIVATEYDRFNALYGEVQSELGLPARALPRDAEGLAAETRAVSTPVGSSSRGARQDATVTAAVPTRRSNTRLALVGTLFGVGLLAAGGIVYLWMRQTSQRRRRLLEISRGSPAPSGRR
ncbi:MAG: hypothetical protein KF774_01105 [Planctomyces sp.]|nr:hypothetical protein [Planctomyces sp.]